MVAMILSVLKLVSRAVFASLIITLLPTKLHAESSYPYNSHIIVRSSGPEKTIQDVRKLTWGANSITLCQISSSQLSEERRIQLWRELGVKNISIKALHYGDLAWYLKEEYSDERNLVKEFGCSFILISRSHFINAYHREPLGPLRFRSVYGHLESSIGEERYRLIELVSVPLISTPIDFMDRGFNKNWLILNIEYSPFKDYESALKEEVKLDKVESVEESHPQPTGEECSMGCYCNGGLRLCYFGERLTDGSCAQRRVEPFGPC
ncbi:MAG: hypothetical protein AAGF76_09910 [Pseudomonadota bacterium]